MKNINSDLFRFKSKENTIKQQNAISILFLSFLIGVFFSVFFENASILVCVLLGAIPTVLIARRENKNLIKEFLLYYLVAISFVLLVYFGNIQVFGTPYYHGGSDDALFEKNGLMFISNDYYWPWDYHYSSNVKGMYWLMSYLIRISDTMGGYHTLSFRLININMYLSTALVTHLLFDRYFANSVRESRRFFLLVALFPAGLYLSSYVFRDTIVVLIIMVALALCDDIHNKGNESLLTHNKLIAIIALVAISFVGMWFRLEVVFYVLVIFGLSFLQNKDMKGKRMALLLIPALLALFLVSRLGSIDYVSDKITRYQNYRGSLASVDSNQVYQAIFNLSMFPFGFLLRVAFGLYSPLPTALLRFYTAFDSGIDFLQIIIAIGTCWQAVNLPFLFQNMKRLDKYTLCFWFIFISIIISTFTIRHFIMIYPLLILLISRTRNALDYTMKKRGLILGSGFLVLLAAVYLVI